LAKKINLLQFCANLHWKNVYLQIFHLLLLLLTKWNFFENSGKKRKNQTKKKPKNKIKNCNPPTACWLVYQ
jgi:hypothetical protein